MAMRRTRDPELEKEITYSPTEVANEELLPWLKRAMIYRLIQRGKIKVVLDDYGHKRITLEEIERLRNARAKEDLQATTESIRKHLNRAAVYHRLATTTPEDMVAAMLAAKRKRLEQIVDPTGTCSPEELERRIDYQQRAEMEKLNAKREKKRLLRQQYKATHSLT